MASHGPYRVPTPPPAERAPTRLVPRVLLGLALTVGAVGTARMGANRHYAGRFVRANRAVEARLAQMDLPRVYAHGLPAPSTPRVRIAVSETSLGLDNAATVAAWSPSARARVLIGLEPLWAEAMPRVWERLPTLADATPREGSLAFRPFPALRERLYELVDLERRHAQIVDVPFEGSVDVWAASGVSARRVFGALHTAANAGASNFGIILRHTDGSVRRAEITAPRIGGRMCGAMRVYVTPEGYAIQTTHGFVGPRCGEYGSRAIAVTSHTERRDVGSLARCLRTADIPGAVEWPDQPRRPEPAPLGATPEQRAGAALRIAEWAMANGERIVSLIVSPDVSAEQLAEAAAAVHASGVTDQVLIGMPNEPGRIDPCGVAPSPGHGGCG